MVTAIGRFCWDRNQRCQPFSWTRDADQALATRNRQTTSATAPLASGVPVGLALDEQAPRQRPWLG
jgi:hypothetical protein